MGLVSSPCPNFLIIEVYLPATPLIHHSNTFLWTATAVQRYVQLVIQIVGYAKIPLIPRKDTEVTSWYGKVCDSPHLHSCSLLHMNNV